MLHVSEEQDAVSSHIVISDREGRGLFSVIFLADKRLETEKFGKQ